MIGFSKKMVSIISFSTAITVGASTIVSAIAVSKQDNSFDPSNNENNNPLDRDDSYKKYNISQKIAKHDQINEIVSSAIYDNNLIYIIDEQKFITTLSKIIKDVLKNDNNFSNHYDEFVIECNYKIISNTNIKTDLVWYLPNGQRKYFDQFDLFLSYY